MLTKILLIRHGQTHSNRAKKYSGSLDIGLDKKGRAQAKKLCRKLSKNLVDKIYSSNKKRALESAKIIFKHKKIEKDPGLREMCFGIFEGLSYSQILKKYPYYYRKWIDDPAHNPIPKGESIKDFKKRVALAFKKIVSNNKNKTVAVVSHGGPISIFLNTIRKEKDFRNLIPHPASLTIVEYKNNKAKIKLFNDTIYG